MLAAGRVVDVVSHVMDGQRPVDEGTSAIARSLVDRQIVLQGWPLFAAWPAMREFCERGWAALAEVEAVKGPYEDVHSRVMWPAAHFLAALYAIRRPGTPWTAEFSDPVSIDVTGERRRGRVHDDELSRELRSGLAAATGYELPADATVFEWCEALAYGLADELHFTNAVQLDVMLERCPPPLRERLRARALVVAQPTLPERFYRMAEVDLELEPEVAHIGYYGSFSTSRGPADVLAAFAALDDEALHALRLHVITAEPDALRAWIAGERFAASVRVEGYRPYLEFLAELRRLDVLLVTDTVTRDGQRNPYLPSKLSDYRGSGTPVWGHVQPGSPLSQEPLDHVSRVGDVASVAAVLRDLAAR